MLDKTKMKERDAKRNVHIDRAGSTFSTRFGQNRGAHVAVDFSVEGVLTSPPI